MASIDQKKIKTWFIAGASSGIGYELAIQLLNRGYNVVATARHRPKIFSSKALSLVMDAANVKSIKAALDKAIDCFGEVDVLFNSVGTTSHVTVEEENSKHMHDIMETNFFTSFNTINVFLPYFRKVNNGTIINNTSMHGLAARINGGAYCASKHALEGLSTVLRSETYRFCRVMCVEFGYYPGTEIEKNALIKKTKIKEYQNLHGKNICEPKYINNDIKKAIEILISAVEQKKLPRHLILGRDAYEKIRNFNKVRIKDTKLARKNSRKISNFKMRKILGFWYAVLKKFNLHNLLIIKIIRNKLTK